MSSSGRTGALESLIIVADDYGLAPGVNRSIRKLLSAERIDGTGCMTLFSDWKVEAAALKALCESREIEAGLHLTLTDFDPMSGRNALGQRAVMPSVNDLIKASYRRTVDFAAVERELDAQLAAFIEAMDAIPAYIDGHQHVHFLAVRAWLKKRAPLFAEFGVVPWLRGAPSVLAASGLKIRAKTAVVAMIAAGFNRTMRKSGYIIEGPLVGFYDWNNPQAFEPMLLRLRDKGPANGVLMCHPGSIDATLRKRDGLIDAREVEYAVLSTLGTASPPEESSAMRSLA